MNETRSKKNTKKLAFSGVFLAAALLLPFLTGQLPQIGSMLSPMHLPVLLCGFVCGWPWGLAVGFIAPALRFVLFGMPPIFPTGVSMMFELATYGAAAGILYRIWPKTTKHLYLALVCAMLAGRAVWGAVRFALAGAAGVPFGWPMFAAGAFTGAVPGIVLQLIVIVPIVLALKKAGYLLNE